MCQPFKVICLNDKGRPDGIPTSKWVKEGEPYTVIEVSKLTLQGNIIGYKLAEINIDDCLPYQYFAANRFGIPIQEEIAEEVSEEIETVCH